MAIVNTLGNTFQSTLRSQHLRVNIQSILSSIIPSILQSTFQSAAAYGGGIWETFYPPKKLKGRPPWKIDGTSPLLNGSL